MSYNPQRYWEKRAPSYSQAPPQHELENFQQWMQELRPKSILEVGSGWGVIYQALASIGLGHVTSLCDISPTMCQNCEQRTGVLPVLWDGTTLPFENDRFEVVVSFNVMLHVPPSRIEHFISEHMRVARRYLFVATYVPAATPERLAAHVFVHDYYKLFPNVTVYKAKHWTDRAHWILTW